MPAKKKISGRIAHDLDLTASGFGLMHFSHRGKFFAWRAGEIHGP
jgi:hypothetical protein